MIDASVDAKIEILSDKLPCLLEIILFLLKILNAINFTRNIKVNNTKLIMKIIVK